MKAKSPRSFESLPQEEIPAFDFRVMIGNSETIEEKVMLTENSIAEKRTILKTWKKAKKLLNGMIKRLNENIAAAEHIQKQLDAEREKAILQNASNGILRSHF